ncbi:MAG: IS3 family transposase [Chitinophagales bacterium]
MKEMYLVAGISRQAMHKYRRRQQQVNETTQEVIHQMQQIRKHHRRMSCRRMYYAVQKPLPVGRDLFEQIGFANGFKLKPKRSVMRTTWSQRVEIYPNLIEGMKLNGINQVWQSDIFYLNVDQQHYYGVTIEDVYTRELLALHLSKNLDAEQLTLALRKALQVRKGTDVSGCIFHSDRGTQYISHSHKQLIREHALKISMGKLPQENAYVERLQGILKQEYLECHELTTRKLYAAVRKTIRLYNSERPHSSLNMMKPEAFKSSIQQLSPRQRPTLKIHQGFVESAEEKKRRKNFKKSMWKSGKNTRLFSKEVFSTFPHRNSNNNKFVKKKIKQKRA